MFSPSGSLPARAQLALTSGLVIAALAAGALSAAGCARAARGPIHGFVTADAPRGPATRAAGAAGLSSLPVPVINPLQALGQLCSLLCPLQGDAVCASLSLRPGRGCPVGTPSPSRCQGMGASILPPSLRERIPAAPPGPRGSSSLPEHESSRSFRLKVKVSARA